MADAEILIIGDAEGIQAAGRTASLMQRRLFDLGANVKRVLPIDEDVQVVADELRAALRRGPALVALIGADEVVRAAVAAATEREAARPAPDQSRAGEGSHFVLIEATTYLVALGPSDEGFERYWAEELGDSLAEWLGQPPHIRGELVLLDAGLSAAEGLIERVGRSHPAVHLKVQAEDGASGSVRVIALARGMDADGHRDVDAALADVERAASAARLRISSRGRAAARRVGATNA